MFYVELMSGVNVRVATDETRLCRQHAPMKSRRGLYKHSVLATWLGVEVVVRIDSLQRLKFNWRCFEVRAIVCDASSFVSKQCGPPPESKCHWTRMAEGGFNVAFGSRQHQAESQAEHHCETRREKAAPVGRELVQGEHVRHFKTILLAAVVRRNICVQDRPFKEIQLKGFVECRICRTSVYAVGHPEGFNL